MNAIKPATPLPCKAHKQHSAQHGRRIILRGGYVFEVEHQHAEHLDVLDHRANAYPELVAALGTIASVLESPRDRLGRLDIAATQGDQREALRLLAVKYSATGSHDYMGQCAKVARALLAKLEAA